MARTKKEENPRLQIFFELLEDTFLKGKENLTSREFVVRDKIENKCSRNINNYCNELVRKGFLIPETITHEKGEDKIVYYKSDNKIMYPKGKPEKKGTYSKKTIENSYSLNWNGFAGEIIKQLIEEDFEPDEKTIESIKDVLKCKECKEFYKRTKNIGSEKSFYIYLFNPNLLNREDISSKLKKAIKSIKRLKEKIRNEHCPESKIPKDYLIEPFLKNKEV